MPKKKCEPQVPKYIVETLARCILPEIQGYFESDKGKQEFAEWKEKQKVKRKGA